MIILDLPIAIMTDTQQSINYSVKGRYRCLLAIALISNVLASCGQKSVDRNTEAHTYPSKDYNGLTWMTENLRNEFDSAGRPVPYYVPDNDSSNIPVYGLLYDFKTACKVCPEGWHLPTAGEWEQLAKGFGTHSADSLKDLLYWNPSGVNFTNRDGFSARPAGYGNNGEFDNFFGTRAIFWSATKADTHFVKGFMLTNLSDSMRSAPQHPTYAFSVRCVRNTGKKLQ